MAHVYRQGKFGGHQICQVTSTKHNKKMVHG